MQKAARTDPAIAARVAFFSYRVREEFYDYETDPNALANRIDDPKYKTVIAKLRAAMLDVMTTTKDPLLPAFRRQIGLARGEG
jgi:N-sulfoglucosamine sulfohydrolase